MKIVILAIGKRHSSLFATAIDTYAKRIARSVQLEWHFIASPKASMSEAEQKKHESMQLLNVLKPGDTVILLDERGDQWSTTDLAAKINTWQHGATQRLVFVIGGAYGVSSELRARASHVWSLSKLVFPHQMVRLIVIEQLYRAFSVLRGEPYHHE